MVIAVGTDWNYRNIKEIWEYQKRWRVEEVNLDRHQLKMVENWGMICGFNKDSDYLHDCGSLGKSQSLGWHSLIFFWD